MTPATLVQLLRRRVQLSLRDAWSRAHLERHQAQALRTLRDFAVARSPYYALTHAGLEWRPLHELPIVTKEMLLSQFDDIATDRALRLDEITDWLEHDGAHGLFRNRYVVSTTSGTSGRRAVIPADPDEWLTTLSSYVRANDWAHVPAGVTRRLRLAVVSSRHPSHQSARVGAALDSAWVDALRLDATDALANVVAALNRLEPELLVGYASMLRVLADEALGGRLHVRPTAVISASEVLSPDMRRALREAFGVEPFDTYAATETAGIASECDRHDGMHLFEDLVIAESVDDANRPVPPGRMGDKLLVTVLFSRTIPLIRYEMSDRLMTSSRRCPCGRPFALIERVGGRSEELLTLPSEDGGFVRVHPSAIEAVLESAPVAVWRVRAGAADLAVQVSGPRPGFDRDRLTRELQRVAGQAGATTVDVTVEVVSEIPRTAAGKVRRIERQG